MSCPCLYPNQSNGVSGFGEVDTAKVAIALAIVLVPAAALMWMGSQIPEEYDQSLVRSHRRSQRMVRL